MAKEITIVRQASNNAEIAVNSMSISASRNVSSRRVMRNAIEADELEREGYKVERNKHPNGAYFAVYGKHPGHELEVGRIFAENGISLTLDREGMTAKINGKTYILPSPDGHLGGVPKKGLTHEIYKLGGKPDARTVAEAIKHTYKPFRPDPSKSVRSEVAITISPIGSQYRKENIADGVAEYKRQVSAGETTATPRLYLHVDESRRKIYKWDIK